MRALFFRKGNDMRGKLIVLEGIDGSGKATQAELLERALRREGHRVMRISFPDYESDSSALVRMYLAGDFGSDPDAVNPYAASLFYAVDRFASYRMKWKRFYEAGGIVIADRYTTSNMVHQMTKIARQEEREAFLNWLEKTEYEELELPRPDQVFLLDMPPEISSMLYLRRCHEAYQLLAARYGWIRVACTENEGLRERDSIAAELLRKADRPVENS